MRFFLSSLLVVGSVFGPVMAAVATPTKAETRTLVASTAHGKAGRSDSANLASFDPAMAFLSGREMRPMGGGAGRGAAKAVARVVKVAKPVIASLPRSVRRAPQALNVEGVPSRVAMVTLLPGARIPLRVYSATGRALTVKWRASAGELALGQNMAVWTAPLKPGAHRLTAYGLLNGRTVSRTLSMIVTVPTTLVRDGKLNGYPIGTYPRGFGQPVSQIANRGERDAYTVPSGFIELTPETLDVPVSEHYTVGDFAGKDTYVNGRKYLFIEPRLVEKLETLIDTLGNAGYANGKLQLMSAYRSPYLNRAIGNDTTLSRHTYGDAADMEVTDFNRDGRVDRTDATVLMAAVTKLDTETPLTGGASLYQPNGAHGYFIHTDTRGTLIRW